MSYLQMIRQSPLISSIKHLCSPIDPFAKNPPTPYSFFGFRKYVRIEVGSFNVVANVIRALCSLRQKVFFLNPNIGSGNFDQATLDGVRDFLQSHQLQDVLVSANQYNPRMVWERIFTNPRTSTLSKYTIGVISGLFYTVRFDKLFNIRGDYYDPMANVVHLTSNDLAIALYHCSHAADFNSMRNVTLYGLVPACLRRLFPYLSSGRALVKRITVWELARNAIASSKAIAHLKATSTTEQVKHAYHMLTVNAASSLVISIYLLVASRLDISRFQSQCENEAGRTGASECPDAKNELYLYYQMVFFITSVSVMAVGHLVGRLLAHRVRPKPLSFWDFTPWASKA